MASSDIVAVTETTTLLGKPDPSDTAAVENGAVREVDAENPLFEGNAKAAQKLYLLVPAVGFGVSFCWRFVVVVYFLGGGGRY